MLEIIEVKSDNNRLIKELSQMACEIVKDYYDPIIGAEQNDYMIRKFQSTDAISDQIKQGACYYIARDAIDVGFCAFYPKNGKIYLSKFYIHALARGKGYGRSIFEFVKSKSKEAGYNAIFLNVNKNNSNSIAIYNHLGFEKVADEKNDIGGGYFMDDYVMECYI